jgi:hypothetical protein
MPLTAICKTTGKLVESFSVSDEEWKAMRANKGGYLIRRSQKPAVLKQNQYGTRWFQSMPGDRDPNYKPESAAHEMTKIWMVNALRDAGYPTAVVEKFGTTPQGDSWEADVYLEADDRKIAIEVQISPQSLEDYLSRTDRYQRSGVKVVWLVRHYRKFSIEAVRRKGFRRGDRGMYPDLYDVPALELEVRCPLDHPEQDRIRVSILDVTETRYLYRQISLREFAVGVAERRLTFRDKDRWMWKSRLASSEAAIGSTAAPGKMFY